MRIILFILVTLFSTSQLSAFNYDKLGSNNVYVSSLQNFLIERHYLNIGKPTGYFGKLTESALRRYQYDRGLKVTGVLDWETMNEYKKENME